MKIESPTLRHADGQVFIEAKVHHQGKQDLLYFSVPEQYRQHVSPELGDAFLLALLPQAMLLGEDIEIDAKVSERLLYSLQHYFIPLYRMIAPKLSLVSITALRGMHRTAGLLSRGAGTGFSGGIDSFCLVAEHFGTKTKESYQITALLFNNVGAVPPHLFHEKYLQLRSATEKLNISLIPINSNLSTFIDLKFELTHTLRNTACAMLLQGLYSKYIYASAYSYQSTRVSATDYVAYIDPLALPLLSTEGLEVIPAGGQHTRVEKTAIVADFAYSHQWLNVCVAANRIDNCSVCGKCGRTLLTLELLGRTEAYSEVFDLEKWKAARSWYVAEHILNKKKRHDPLSTEILELARSVGHRFSTKERLMAAVATYAPQGVVNKLKRWL